MLTDFQTISVLGGVIAGVYLLTAFAWSIAFPEKRVWPPRKATIGIKLRIWPANLAMFAAAFTLGIMDWNNLDWPASIRWGFGFPLIVIGNIIVLTGVAKIGVDATNGEIDELKTDGPYAYSRNPQYVAAMFILFGWAVLSASTLAILIAVIGIAAFAVAPISEEPWLEENYGKPYRDYKARVRRYL